ncbi:MAG: alginate lyase family protein [Lentisphaerae bacterium]|jgi:hypothetical protein|nr:alginate lyase family protein [Lentisphaerota bacterium]MBT4822208.1 alginate lyase family protein [Lentisphaerota bacterium]MBT5612762.1 alginate lyase family protein [Lentisphaerota bacterium]MBT7058991.1 alginate lyase family protein [Lentisphaerota bacterium]MBT7848411.1 alginate lyase family protein [Lentisphaerota bacterium]
MFGCASVTMTVCLACAGAQPPELRAGALALAPSVRLADDAAFFGVWDLERQGLEAVKEAADQQDYETAKIALKAYFLARRTPHWRIKHWLKPAVPKGSAAKHSKFGQGEEVLAHRFKGGGHEVDFGEKIDWNYFPIRFEDGTPDTEYPLIHYINRFNHLSTVLGPLYWYSHDERYAREFVYEVTDHTLSNPAPDDYIRHTAVWSKLTAAGPLCGSWLDGYNYFLTSPEFTPEAHAIMLRRFVEKARYAVRNPDRVNRYMIQLRGIYNVGAYFPELKEAAALRAFAAKAMSATVGDEFYPDGMSKELCPGYHGGSAGAIREMVNAALLFGYEAPSELVEGLAEPYSVYAKLATPLGSIPAFGDTWGRPRIRRIYASLRKLFDRPEHRWFATNGEDGAPPSFRSTRLPWAGFYVMRSGWDREAKYLCMDAGPLGIGHWHEDLGNFECYAFGEVLVTEVGIYSYTTNAWNQYFRSSQAHNVVLVDGLSQNRACELSTYGLAEGPRQDDWHSDDVFDLAWSEYDGKWIEFLENRGWRNRFGGEKATPLATHRREILFVKDDYWIIVDRLRAQGEHEYEQLFHFEPGRRVVGRDGPYTGTADVDRANICFVQASPTRVDVVSGQEEPLQGWYSGAHGEKEPAPVLRFVQEATDVCLFDTVMLPMRPGESPDLSVRRLPVVDASGVDISPAEVCALEILRGEKRDIVVVDLRVHGIMGESPGLKRVAGVETDARAAVLRFGSDRRLVCASVAGGAHLRLDGVPVRVAR